MTPEAYIEAMAAAGIDRAGLEHGMSAINASGVSSLHEPYCDYDVGFTKPKPPPAEEDLSHLNSPHWKASRLKHRRKCGRKKGFATNKNTCTAMVVWKPAA